MAYLTVIKDQSGCTLVTLAGVHDLYRFDDGSTMFVDTRAAWCRKCREFVLAENLKSPEEIEWGAREFAAQRAKMYLLPFNIISQADQDRINLKLLEKSLDEARNWRAALQKRMSPPRCLECGGADFVTIVEDGTLMAHPGDASRRIRVEPDIIHASMASTGRVYDTEGCEIKELSDERGQMVFMFKKIADPFGRSLQQVDLCIDV